MAATDPSVLSGLFKEQYPDEMINLVPEQLKVQKAVKFVPSDKETGNYYHQPVIVQQEHGVTYAGPTAGAFALNAAVPMATQDAQVRGNQMLLRAALSYDLAAKSSTSKKAFKKGTRLIVESMQESIRKRLELSCLYGQASATAVNASAGLGTCTAAGIVDVSATTHYFVVSDATWAPGIWSGLEGAKLQFYYDNSGTYTLISSGADSIGTVTAVDTDNKRILVTMTATGIGAVETQNDSTDVVAFFYGAFTNEMVGLNGIVTNTGTLFNISAASYGQWKSNVHTISGQLTFGKITQGIAVAVGRGLMEDVTCYLSPKTWQNVCNDQAALREYDVSYDGGKEAKNGFRKLSFVGQNGLITLEPHSYVKEGDAFYGPFNRAMRVGAQDVSFQTPGREGDIFLHLADNAGYELRVYTDQALFIEEPYKFGKFTGFTNV